MPKTSSGCQQPINGVVEVPAGGKLSEKLKRVIAASEKIASGVHNMFTAGNISIALGVSTIEGSIWWLNGAKEMHRVERRSIAFV